MSPEEIYERCVELVSLTHLKPKEAERGVTEMYRLLRKCDPAAGDPCDLYEAGVMVAQVLSCVGKPDLALQVARWAWSIDCDDKNEGEYYHLLGSCYLQMSRKEKEAADALNRATELFKHQTLLPVFYRHQALLPVVYDDAGRANERVGDYARALECWLMVIELLPNPQSYQEKDRKEKAHIHAAECYSRMDRETEALEMLRTVLSMRNPTPWILPRAYYSLGGMQEYKGDMRAAAESYRKAIAAADEDIERRRQPGYPQEGCERDVAGLKAIRRNIVSDLRRCEREIT